MRTKMRRGLKRVIVHIILLAILGAAALPCGIVGLNKLDELVEAKRPPIESTKVMDGVRSGLFTLLTDNYPERREQSKLKNPMNSVEPEIQAYVTEEVASGSSTSRVIENAIDMYVEASAANVANDQALSESFAKLIAENKRHIISSINEQVRAEMKSVNRDYVRSTMGVTSTEYYALMYYSMPLIIVGAVALFFAALLLVLWFMNDEDGRVKVASILEPIDYLLPFLAGVSVFTLYPMIRTTLMSFQYMYTPGMTGGGDWGGLYNYKFVLFGVEGTSNVFLQGLKNTAMYVVLTIPISTALSIIIAYLLNQKIKGNGIFQTAYFLPMVTTVTAVGLIWRYIFNQRFGLMNAIVTGLGGVPQDWLGAHPMTVLVVFGVWSSLPFTIILLLSGLQNIDDNLYTVAKVDGSGAARIFFRITVPLLSPTIGLVLIINSISAFKVYTDVVVLWKGTPQDSGMQTVTWYIYDQIQAKPDGIHTLGFAAAAAMVLFVIIFAFTMLQKLIQRKWVYQ